MNDAQKFFAEVSKRALDEFPKASLLRKMGSLYKLDLGQVALLENVDAALHLDDRGRATTTIDRDRVILGEIPLAADVKVFARPNAKTLDEAVEKMLSMLCHKEQGLISDLLADAVFVPKSDYYRVRRFLRNLDKPTVLIPVEHVEEYLKQNLVTMVRMDATVNWVENAGFMHHSLAIHEVVAPAIMQGNWVPGNG